MDCQVREYLWHPSFPDWLYGRLEEMGFDGSVYSHYIMSVLKQPAGLNDALAKSKSSGRVSVDCCPPKATLFECLMSSDIEKDIVKVFVDDIIGKYVQWCHYMEDDKMRNSSRGKDNRRISLNLENDEAFPPLYRDGPSVVKRYVVQKNEEDVQLSEVPCQQLNRESSTTPKKRIKLEKDEQLCNEAALIEEGAKWHESCLNLDQDDVGDLLDEISRVALAFNNVIPNGSSFRPDPVAYNESSAMWNGMLGLCAGSNVQDNVWACWSDFAQSRGNDYGNSFHGHLVNSLQCVPLEEDNTERQCGLHMASSIQSAFTGSNRRLYDSSKILSYIHGNGTNGNAVWQQQQWMFKIRRRIPTGPVDIPISDATHFIPIRSESMQASYFPYTALERQFEDAYGGDEATVPDGRYFVYHEAAEEDEDDCADERTTNLENKRSLTLRFRAVKLDKFCQTEWYPSHRWLSSSSVANESGANCSTGAAMPSHKAMNDQFSVRNHNADKEVDEASSGEVWQYQDEKDDEMLIRYVSSISLINPLDLNSSSVNGTFS